MNLSFLPLPLSLTPYLSLLQIDALHIIYLFNPSDIMFKSIFIFQMQNEVTVTMFFRFCARGHTFLPKTYSAVESSFFKLIPKILQNSLALVK